MGCVIISESTIGAVEDFGKFSRIINPGFHCINPFTENVAHRRSLQLIPADISIETVTKESLSIKIKVGIQYRIMQSDAESLHYSNDNTIELSSSNEHTSKSYNTFSNKSYQNGSLLKSNNIDTNIDTRYRAIYTTANPQLQLTQHVEAYFREIGCNYTMKDMFLSKSKLSDDLVVKLNKEMNQFGYCIHRALITDIDPPQNVKETMNLVLSSQNKRDAAIMEADGKKSAAILEAEGLAKVRELEGIGLANQRKALADGLKDSISDFGGDPGKLDARELTTTIITMQYIEMLNHAAISGKNTFILPTTVNTIEDQIRTGLLSSIK